jgi:7-cyano-7-deazaguanine synthase in queuosine biosynthesis
VTGFVDRPPDPGRETLFLNLSGGVDSTFALWRLLADGHKIVAHHCQVRNREGRGPYEKAAVDAVLRWLAARRLDRRLTYVESGYDHGSLGRLIYDVEVIGFYTGVALRDPSRRRIQTVVISANANDATVTRPDAPRIVRRRLIAEATAGRKLRWWVPFASTSKVAMVEQLPADLLALTWWCRRPTDGRRCRKCKPCREVDAATPTRPLQFDRTKEPA